MGIFVDPIRDDSKGTRWTRQRYVTTSNIEGADAGPVGYIAPCPNCRPAVDLIQEELARLIDSDVPRRAPAALPGDKRIAGDAAALRETAIALEVFRRDPATFDPQTDPIVRVTTGRLRDRLEAHYARYDAPPNADRPAKGRYAPEFVEPKGATAPLLGLAVLRTRNLTRGSKIRCDAFTDRLADHLARAGLARVLARGSVDSAERVSRDPALLGKHLQVPWLIEATLAREQGNELRLSVRLCTLRMPAVRWVETGVGTTDEIYRLTDRLLDIAGAHARNAADAGGVARQRTLAVAVDRAAARRARPREAPRPAAHSDCHRAGDRAGRDGHRRVPGIE